MHIINSHITDSIIKEKYSSQDIKEIFSFLRQKGTFSFFPLENGLFPAAILKKEIHYSGYSNVWVRDNIYVAYAHHLNGCTSIAVKNVKTLAQYFIKYKWRLEKIITDELDYNEPMNRPHIRFNGKELSEIKQKWAHAENDALGYFVWLFCKLHHEGFASPSSDEKMLLTLFAIYFKTIHYWEDEDSGHWEETRKKESSSIGVVLKALMEFKTLLQKEGCDGFVHLGKSITIDFLDSLIDKGKESLYKILPAESTQVDSKKNRRYDAALLFLIFPIDVVTEDIADQILFDVTHHLQGDYGIRRYVGDSFWSADYKDNFKQEERTIDFSDNISLRDSLLIPGQEAQWCIFDPIISVIYGLKYQQHHQKEHLQRQIHYFKRSLGQLTTKDNSSEAYSGPELYYLKKGKYLPNDIVPLLWTQANLWIAFRFIEDSLSI